MSTRVKLQYWSGDLRPSQKRYTMGSDGGPVEARGFARLYEEYVWDTTPHGARTIVGRERNAETSRLDHVAMEKKTRADGAVLHYIVSRWEGLYTTVVLWSEEL